MCVRIVGGDVGKGLVLTTRPASLYNPAVDQFQSTTTTAAIWRERERENRPTASTASSSRGKRSNFRYLDRAPSFHPLFSSTTASTLAVDGRRNDFSIPYSRGFSFFFLFFFFFQVRCSRKFLERRGRVSGKTTCTMTTSIIEKRYNLVSGPCSSDSNRSLLLLPPYDFSLVISKRYFPFPVSFHRGQRGVIDRCLLFARGVRRCW